MPNGRGADEYRKIGKALSVATYKAVAPLCEYLSTDEDLCYRFRRAGYALYDEEGIEKLKQVLEK